MGQYPRCLLLLSILPLPPLLRWHSNLPPLPQRRGIKKEMRYLPCSGNMDFILLAARKEGGEGTALKVVRRNRSVGGKSVMR